MSKHSVEVCELCRRPTQVVNMDGVTMVPCPTCTHCATCGGDVSFHMVVPAVGSAIHARRTSDPDAGVRRAFVHIMSASVTPARTGGEWLEVWGKLTEAERQVWREGIAKASKE